MNRQCAHNFPAVAFTLGRKNWNELRETYKALASDHQVGGGEIGRGAS